MSRFKFRYLIVTFLILTVVGLLAFGASDAIRTGIIGSRAAPKLVAELYRRAEVTPVQELEDDGRILSERGISRNAFDEQLSELCTLLNDHGLKRCATVPAEQQLLFEIHLVAEDLRDSWLDLYTCEEGLAVQRRQEPEKRYQFNVYEYDYWLLSEELPQALQQFYLTLEPIEPILSIEEMRFGAVRVFRWRNSYPFGTTRPEESYLLWEEEEAMLAEAAEQILQLPCTEENRVLDPDALLEEGPYYLMDAGYLKLYYLLGRDDADRLLVGISENLTSYADKVKRYYLYDLQGQDLLICDAIAHLERKPEFPGRTADEGALLDELLKGIEHIWIYPNWSEQYGIWMNSNNLRSDLTEAVQERVYDLPRGAQLEYALCLQSVPLDTIMRAELYCDREETRFLFLYQDNGDVWAWRLSETCGAALSARLAQQMMGTEPGSSLVIPEPEPEPESESRPDFAALDFSQVARVSCLWQEEDSDVVHSVLLDEEQKALAVQATKDAVVGEKLGAAAEFTRQHLILAFSGGGQLTVYYQPAEDAYHLTLAWHAPGVTSAKAYGYFIPGEDPFAELFAAWKP